ncbi:PD-(D/E)XK nuclease family protein [Methanocalculus sp.]|uniref:PD-(D/E)XK nuclease family protein n=1 Tax=Methanocalculus sp. TaxID=2004547 RepID=UPI00260EE6E9|nr:PD-(D/E)XK nuclease family protein [Methanocalculus sp.]MDG6250793.1 PD-(D/E)XK nuclease family protein [Methanocalculus sp.]
MTWRLFRELKGKIPPKKLEIPKRSYSVTSDIIAYKICPRQYGLMKHRGYKSAHNIQLWFGTAVHQVLKKLHMQYRGLIIPEKEGKIPSDIDVEKYFEIVNQSLVRQGIRAMNAKEEKHALKVIKKFNEIEGPKLYPNIIDTEFSFQSDMGEFILEGIVDVLKETSSDEVAEGYHNVEIWDYKASKNPKFENKPLKIEKYSYQMLVYAELYHKKTGYYPRKGILYFMNELENPENIALSREEIQEKAVIKFDFTDKKEYLLIKNAIEDFSQTVSDIERCKDLDLWDAPEKMVDEDTCNGCDGRWDCNCPEIKGNKKYKMRYP